MSKSKRPEKKQVTTQAPHKFHVEFMNVSQEMAYAAFTQHDILFMLGPAGTAKTHLSMAFAISEILQKNRKKIIMVRPIVEAGESLGFLPGTLGEKVDPYLLPLMDCLEKLVGVGTPHREIVNRTLQYAPLAYMRGRTFDDAVCILDEAQNATSKQLKLFLTRLGSNTKMIINGDLKQSDLREVALGGIVDRLQSISGIGVIKFNKDAIVRHKLVSAIVEALEEQE